jgi:hypothetical protein
VARRVDGLEHIDVPELTFHGSFFFGSSPAATRQQGLAEAKLAAA